MASSSNLRQARLNPLRSRHVSQGTLVLPMTANSQTNKISVAAARPPSIITSTSVTPFSPDEATLESINQIETTGAFFSITPSTTLSPLPESVRMPQHGTAPDVLRASQRSQRTTDEVTPTASRQWPQPSNNSGSNGVKAFDEADSSSLLSKDKIPTPTRIKSSRGGEAIPQSQYTRTQFQNPQQHQRHKPDNSSAAVTLRSTGLAYEDVVETEDLENLCLRLGLSRNDVRRLRQQCNDEDGDNTDTITQSSFFFLIGEERHNLSRRLFRIAGLPPSQSRLSFDQYLTIVATFATFTEAELLKFFYDVYCADTESGAMLTSEIQSLGEELRAVNGGLAKNITVAIKKMASSRNVMAVAVASSPATNQQQLDGMKPAGFTFADFEKLVKKNLAAFYPLIRMQRNMRRSTLGEAFWAAKTREKKAVQDVLVYMKAHQGRVPELSIKDRVVGSIFRWETTGSRVRTLAEKIYAATNH